MANILGRSLLSCVDKYNGREDKTKLFDEFFLEYLDKNVLDKEILFDEVNDFIKEEFTSIKESSTDEEINEFVNSFRNLLLSKNIIKDECDIYELIGYILLGNILNN